MEGPAIRGVIEGFYGTPWTWTARAEVMRWCHERGLTHYVYAPKDDPRHRHAWREPYGAEDLAGFESLVAEGTLEVGFALSPGLSIDYGDHDDRRALAAKVDQVVATGIDLVCLALDDIAVRPGLGPDHAALTTWLAEHLDGRARVVLVPTEYTGVLATPYLDALAVGVPPGVPIAWTGPTVVCDEVTTDQARARAATLGDRLPLLWDNYPVNDATMVDRLFLGPLRGRATELAEACCGHLANPMVQPLASRLPLASVAAWLRGEDPDAVWVAEADALGWRTFAEACDGDRPARLVAGVVDGWDGAGRVAALDDLATWLDDAAGCRAPGLEDEAATWLDQVHTEAELGRAAVALLRTLDVATDAPFDHTAAVHQALAVGWIWGQVVKAPVSVFGPRLSLRPVLAQWPDGEFAYRGASVTEDANAIDALCRFALARLDAETSSRLPST
jgi:hyaluronoglucosaminidase